MFRSYAAATLPYALYSVVQKQEGDGPVERACNNGIWYRIRMKTTKLQVCTLFLASLTVFLQNFGTTICKWSTKFSSHFPKRKVGVVL